MQLSHKGDGHQVAILEKAMRLSEDVIRYLTVIQNGPLPTPKSTSKDNDESQKSESSEKIKPTEDKTDTPSKEDKKEDSKE